MKRSSLVLLLASLLGAATCLFSKNYVLVEIPLSWADAEMDCRSNNMDLVSFKSNFEIHRFNEAMSEDRMTPSWIGLSKPPHALEFTQWSDGTSVQGTNWLYNEPSHSDGYDCVAVLVSGDWETFNCTETLSFFCYTWYPQIVLVKELKTWDEALRYCRTNYTDLISVTTESDFYAANKTLADQTTSVWTGLRFIDGLWFWVNEEALPSLVTVPSCPAPSFRCGAIEPGTDVLENRNCMKKMNFLCYYEILHTAFIPITRNNSFDW